MLGRYNSQIISTQILITGAEPDIFSREGRGGGGGGGMGSRIKIKIVQPKNVHY